MPYIIFDEFKGLKEKKRADNFINMNNIENEALIKKEAAFNVILENLKFKNTNPFEASKKLRKTIETKPRITYRLEDSESLNNLVSTICDRALYFSRHDLITNGELLLTISNIVEFVPKRIIEKSGIPLARIIADSYIRVTEELTRKEKGKATGIDAVLLDNIYANNLYNIPDFILKEADMEVFSYMNEVQSLSRLARTLPEQ